MNHSHCSSFFYRTIYLVFSFFFFNFTVKAVCMLRHFFPAFSTFSFFLLAEYNVCCLKIDGSSLATAACFLSVSASGSHLEVALPRDSEALPSSVPHTASSRPGRQPGGSLAPARGRGPGARAGRPPHAGRSGSSADTGAFLFVPVVFLLNRLFPVNLTVIAYLMEIHANR